MAAEKDNRSHMILFRVSPKEYEAINENKEKAGLRLSEYARRMLMGDTIVEDQKSWKQSESGIKEIERSGYCAPS